MPNLRPDRVLLDVWGVLHDGSIPFDDAQPLLDRLAHAAVPVSLVSNASWSGERLRADLVQRGFDLAGVEAVWTAGDDARARVAGRAACPIGIDGIAPTPLSRCDVVVLGDVQPGDRPLLERIVAGRIPVVCANPDLAIWDRHGHATPKTGSIARVLQDRGVPVEFAGKPGPGIFQRAAPEGGLHVGDSPATDLAGARAAGLPAVWVRRRPGPADEDVVRRERPVAVVRTLDELWPDGVPR